MSCIRETIEKDGVAIVEGVLTDEECLKMQSGMWDTIEKWTEEWETQIRRDDETTWSQFYKLYPLHSMLIQRYQIGHAQFIWDLRTNPKIVKLFCEIWGVNPEELLCSFDGASFHLPPEVTKRGWAERARGWLHTDQSYTRNSFECIQSWVTAYDVNDGDATLCYLKGSNKFHELFAKTFNKTNKADWYQLTEEEENWYISQGCEKKLVTCPKGSMVFWDSRTIHSGREASNKRKKPNTRCVAYICMKPRTNASKAVLAKKQKAFNEMRTMNHLPYGARLFPVNPRTYGGENTHVSKLDHPVVNNLGMKLAGF